MGIWENERSKIILLSFQLVTRLNSQNRNENSLLMNSDKLICIWILAFPIGIIQVSTPQKWIFWILFQFLTRLLISNILISFVHNSLGEMECVKNVLLSFTKCEKWVSWYIKTKCVREFFLTVRSSSMKDYTCHYVGST